MAARTAKRLETLSLTFATVAAWHHPEEVNGLRDRWLNKVAFNGERESGLSRVYSHTNCPGAKLIH